MRKVNAMTYAIGLLYMTAGQGFSAESDGAVRTGALERAKSESNELKKAQAKENMKIGSGNNSETLSAGFLEFLSNTIIEDETITDPLDMVDIEDSDMKTVNPNSKSDGKNASSPDQNEEK